MTDLVQCEACDKRVPADESIASFDCDFCEECYAAWKAEFDTCAHVWDGELVDDMQGNPARYCIRCSGVVTLKGSDHA